jgi:protein required for attachment to host cells
MKISSKLPQFTKERALIIVAGIYDAIFYLAGQGEINRVTEFEFDKVKYENEKDTYLKTDGTVSVRGGISYENDYQKIAADEFAKNFRDTINKSFKKEKIDSIYIFAPDKNINRIPELLLENLKAKIKLKKEGNYLKKHPFEIIEMIKEL